MKELSLHLLDIAMNSVRGEASKIQIQVCEKPSSNQFFISIIDDGKGIEPEMLKQIKDPFITTRTTRKVGLGIALLNRTCELCDGELTISSQVGMGTTVKASMAYDHIDRPPLGDIAASLMGLFASYEEIHFIYNHIFEEREFTMDIEEIKTLLEGVPLNQPEIYSWCLDYINENIKELKSPSDNSLTKITLDDSN